MKFFNSKTKYEKAYLKLKKFLDHKSATKRSKTSLTNWILLQI